MALFIRLGSASAQDNPITVKVSKQNVKLDEVFALEIEMSKKGSLKSPSLKDFTVVSGPMMSSSSSYVNVNGNSKTVNLITYYYELKPIKEGKFTIGPAKLTTNGKTYQSESITIQVSKAGNPNYYKSLTPLLLFSLSKKEIYQGEAVLVSYTILHNFEQANTSSENFPEQSKCWKHFLNPGLHSWQEYVTNYKGNSYTVTTFKKEIIIPNHSGKFKLTPFSMSMVGVDQYSQQFYELTSDAPEIIVKELPEEPAGFCDGVGSLNCKVKLNRNSINTGEGFDIIYTISGNGNLSFIHLEKPILPAGFEVFDAEENEKLNYSEAGITGTKTFKFPVIAREPGNFTLQINPIYFFNPEKKSYIKITPEALQLTVSGESKSEINVASTTNDSSNVKTDIKGWAKDDADYFSKSDYLFGKPIYYVAILSLPIIYLSLLFFNSRNKPKSKTESLDFYEKQASKFASDKLSNAKAALSASNFQLFYSETYKAMNNYLFHKFQIQPSQLNKNYIEQFFNEKNTEQLITEKLVEILDRCELAQYGALHTTGNETETYNDCIRIIDYFESKK